MFVNARVAVTAGIRTGAETIACESRAPVKTCQWKALWALCLLAVLLPVRAQEVYYIHTDALGSPVAETDANRNVVRRFEYEPYGKVINHPPRDGVSYTGHVEDAATGLLYAQQRYLDRDLGRFLSVDPVTAYDSGDMRFFNRYVYANNNPYKFTDPDGRAAICLVPGPMQVCAAAAVATVKAVVYVGSAVAAGIGALAVYNEAKSGPELPGELVGEQDGKAGTQGGRHNSGPLSPESGGAGDAGKDFEKLTGGQSGPAPADKGYPEGTVVGENGISLRPATDKSGPRIDIPANGDKPAETLHYPKPPPEPEPK